MADRLADDDLNRWERLAARHLVMDRDAVPRLIAEVRALREALAVAEMHEHSARTWRVQAEKAEATIERVRALVDQVTAAGPPDGGTSVCNLLADLRAALDGDAEYAPRSAERRTDVPGTPGGSDPYAGLGGPCGGVATVGTCGDRLTTWHGPIGPCVLTGRHTLHDDGDGVTWSRTNVPTTNHRVIETEEP